MNDRTSGGAAAASDIGEIAGWRHHLHRHPELLYETHETAAFVARKLGEFGCDRVETGIGRTGVVGLIRGRSGASRRCVGLRADMDALPIEEETGLPYRSTSPGRMHACGHDGHTAMLLGAARRLAASRDFDGEVAVIFQPAEEGGAGAKAMIDDGLLDRFAIAEVYGMHNIPGMPLGAFAVRPGPIMASTDEFSVAVTGRGGHAAIPQMAADPIVAGAAIVGGLQQIVSRNADPLKSLVVTVTKFQAGFALNVIPDTAALSGTVRALDEEMRGFAERRIREISAGIGAAHGASATVEYKRNYPVTRNDPAKAVFCGDVATEVAGPAGVDRSVDPLMAGEDFSYMLEKRPGAFVFIGNGPSASLHHAAYDFNDAAIPFGVGYWTRLARSALAA